MNKAAGLTGASIRVDDPWTVRFMGIRAPHLEKRLSDTDKYWLRLAAREEHKYKEGVGKWNKRPRLTELELENDPPAEKPRWWWQDENGEWVGRCAGKNPETGADCGQIIKAVGLVSVDGKMMWGRWKDQAHYCATCRPRLFGKPGGKVRLGIPMWGSESVSNESDT